MFTRDNTPGKIEGFGYSEVDGCNWTKAWSEADPTVGSPFLILLADGTLWIVTDHQPPGTWGSIDSNTPLPLPDTSAFTGPFDDFDVAFTTFHLLAAQA